MHEKELLPGQLGNRLAAMLLLLKVGVEIQREVKIHFGPKFILKSLNHKFSKLSFLSELIRQRTIVVNSKVFEAILTFG